MLDFISYVAVGLATRFVYMAIGVFILYALFKSKKPKLPTVPGIVGPIVTFWYCAVVYIDNNPNEYVGHLPFMIGLFLFEYVKLWNFFIEVQEKKQKRLAEEKYKKEKEQKQKEYKEHKKQHSHNYINEKNAMYLNQELMKIR